jgi:hypothetical protein
MGTLKIKSLLIVGNNRKWKSDVAVTINSIQGSVAIEAP